MSEALFTSTHSALAFAFNYSERRGVPNLLQRLGDQHRDAGRGLAGLDGAGQAGMIRREVQQLSLLERAVVIAKFSRPKLCLHCNSLMDSSERAEALEALAQHALTALKDEIPNLPLRRGLVRKHFGDRIGMAELAKKCGVHQNTVTNHRRKIEKLLNQLERQAMSKLDEALVDILPADSEMAA